MAIKNFMPTLKQLNVRIFRKAHANPLAVLPYMNHWDIKKSIRESELSYYKIMSYCFGTGSSILTGKSKSASIITSENAMFAWGKTANAGHNSTILFRNNFAPNSHMSRRTMSRYAGTSITTVWQSGTTINFWASRITPAIEWNQNSGGKWRLNTPVKRSPPWPSCTAEYLPVF